MERRGVQKSSVHIDDTRIMLQFLLPLNEIIVDFHDKLKSVTSGFASFDYEDHGYSVSTLVKVLHIFNFCYPLVKPCRLGYEATRPGYKNTIQTIQI